MVLITCVRKVMRLKSLGLVDYRVKLNFFDLICYLVHFCNKFNRIICISIEHTYVLVSCTLINLFLLPQNNTYFNDCKYVCCQSVGALKGVLSSYKSIRILMLFRILAKFHFKLYINSSKNLSVTCPSSVKNR